MSRLSVLLVAVLGAFLAACGSGSSGTVEPPAGTAALRTLSGTVREAGGAPLAGVLVREVGGARAHTDEHGNFQLVDLLGGADTLLRVDGTSAGAADQSFAAFRLRVPLPEDAVNVLAAPLTLPDLSSDQAAWADVTAQAGTVADAFATEGMRSDLELSSPAGFAFERDGAPVEGTRRIALARVGATELAVPFPAGLAPTSFVFVQPADASFDPALSARMPNESNLPLGTRVDLYWFDSAAGEWVNRSDEEGRRGRVRPDGASSFVELDELVARSGWYAAAVAEDSNCTTTVVGRIVKRGTGIGVGQVAVLLSSGDRALTDASGFFRIEDVAAYDVAASVTDGTCAAVPIDFELLSATHAGSVQVQGQLDAAAVEPGGQSTLFAPNPQRLELPDSGSIAGILRNAFALDRPVRVRTRPGLELVAEVLPNAGGDFLAENLAPGEYQLRYLFDGEAEATRIDVEVVAGALTVLEMEPGTAPPLPAPANLSYSSNPVAYQVGVAADPNVPSFDGSVDAFSVSPGLPSGLTLDPLSGVIEGIPSLESDEGVYVVTATNGGGSTMVELRLEVGPAPAIELVYGASPLTLVQGTSIDDIVPTVEGAVDAFTMAPDPPAGLEFDGASGVLSGTPQAALEQTNFVVTASNAFVSAQADLVLTVLEAAPSELSYAENPALYVEGVEIEPNVPTVLGNVQEFTVDPALPAGLALDAGDGAIRGTPLSTSAEAAYTITASNGTGTTSTELVLEVIVPAPESLTYSQNPALYVQGQAIAPNEPMLIGVADSYAVNPSLPVGLALDPSSGVISGTPTTLSALQVYVVTATNATGATSVDLEVAIQPPPPVLTAYSLNPAVYTEGVAIADNVPSVSGVVDSFSVSPPLPAGLLLDAASGVIRGTPSAAAAVGLYRVSANNISGSSELDLEITVHPAAPTSLDYTLNPAVYFEGVTIEDNAPIVGGFADMFSVFPALPAGLQIDATTGVISGTPQVEATISLHTVTAANITGGVQGFLFVTVDPGPPELTAYSENPAIYVEGVPIAPNTPSFTGMAELFSVTPPLPAGLVLDPADGVISGTPTQITPTLNYTVSASNPAGATSVDLTLEVNPPAPTSLTYATNPAFYAQGVEIAENVATTDQPVDTFSVVPELPVGLELDAASGVVAGTPSEVVFGRVHTVSASNVTGSTSSELVLTVGADGGGTFPSPEFAYGSKATGVVVADMNGDTIPDLVVDSRLLPSLGISLGVGNGTFGPTTQFALGAGPLGPRDPRVGDFNGDGFMDCAVVLAQANLIAIALGAGDGTLGIPTTFGTGNDPRALALADLNGDGMLDLAVANRLSNSVQLLVGVGDGSFLSPASLIVSSPSHVRAADLTADGRIDLVVAQDGLGQISSFAGLGAGVFAPAVTSTTSSFPTTLRIADLDNDGIQDVVTVDPASEVVEVLTGQGDGTFQSIETHPAPGGSTAEAADLDGDGNLDLVVSGTGGRSFMGAGDGTFVEGPLQVVGESAASAAADVNGDGLPDVVFAGVETTTTLLGLGAGQFDTPEQLELGAITPVAVALAELSANTLPDLVVATSGSVEVRYGSAPGEFEGPALTIPTLSADPAGPGSLAVVDLDDDGLLDIVVVGGANLGMRVLGTAPGFFGSPATFAVGSSPQAVAAADVNADGILDLVVTNSAPDGVSVVLGIGAGDFAAPTTFPSGAEPRALELADFNADGLLDIAFANVQDDNVTVLLAAGGGVFSAPTNFPAGDAPIALASADLDGDGVLDLVCAGEASGDLAVLLGQGGGVFGAPSTFAGFDAARDLALADVDGDGAIDAITAGASRVNVLKGTGGGGFAEVELHSSGGEGTAALQAFDADGDGRLDLATANAGSADVSLLFNRGQ